MDFKDTPEQAQFRQQVQQWLQNNAQPKDPNQGPRGQEGRFEEAKIWYAKIAEAGYSCIDWPEKYGGAGLTYIHKVIWSEEVAKYDTADGYFVIGMGNCGPAIRYFCNDEQKQYFLPRMASAEDVWCQLFSEPAAGSDVAGLRTQAKQGDQGNWLINGQKIWTSGAQYSDYGVVLCRTDPEVSKYSGLTMFMIDMKQPGVEVKPIKQMDGGQHFNEVFFNDAVIPDNYRLGEIGGGWQAALVVLMNERMAIAGIAPDGYHEFLNFARNTYIAGEAIAKNPQVRERLANWHCLHAGVKAAHYRMLTTVSNGGTPGAEGAMGKLVGGKMNQDIAHFSLQLMGEAGLIHDSDMAPMQAQFQRAILYSPGIRLAGGTDEIMRNIIAEQILGLPQEPRADKGMAFNQIPTGPS